MTNSIEQNGTLVPKEIQLFPLIHLQAEPVPNLFTEGS